jgi:hypothetical protein
LTSHEWPSSTAVHWPPARPHNRAVMSFEAVASDRPSGLNAALLTAPECP